MYTEQYFKILYIVDITKVKGAGGLCCNWKDILRILLCRGDTEEITAFFSNIARLTRKLKSKNIDIYMCVSNISINMHKPKIWDSPQSFKVSFLSLRRYTGAAAADGCWCLSAVALCSLCSGDWCCFSTEAVPQPVPGQCLVQNQVFLFWQTKYWLLARKGGCTAAPLLCWTRKNKQLMPGAVGGVNMTK